MLLENPRPAAKLALVNAVLAGGKQFVSRI